MKNTQYRFAKVFYRTLFILFIKPFLFLKYGFKVKSSYHIQKGEPVLVLSNHQTDLDPLFVHFSFNKVFHTVATNTIFKKGFISKVLLQLGTIPKRKGIVDINCNKEIIKTLKSGEGVLLFLEGNRTYADFQFYISPKIGHFVKTTGATLILYNLHGGTGVMPRFSYKRRKGKFFGDINLVLKPEEYMHMSDEELSEIIISRLRVIDSKSNNLYRSNKRAEYLERLFFVCPICHTHSKLVSKGNIFRCTNCNYQVEFGEDLKLHPLDDKQEVLSMRDWYNLQKKWVLNYQTKSDEVIFKDKDIKLKIVDPFKKRKEIYQGEMTLTDQELRFGDIIIPLEKIANASPISGTRLSFADDEHNYLVIGSERFNPLKYVLMFNKLETKMKVDKVDNYYQLEVEEK